MRYRVGAIIAAILAAVLFSAGPASAVETFGNSVSVTSSSSLSGGYVTVYNIAGNSAKVYPGGNSRNITGFYHVQGFKLPLTCVGYSQWGYKYMGGWRYDFSSNYNALILNITCGNVNWA